MVHWNLDYIYMLNVGKLKNDRAAAGDLDGALAAKAELDRLSAHQALNDEQRTAMNPALQPLRTSYDAALLKGYHDEAAKQNAALLQKLLADLDALQTRITTTGDLDKALKVKAERERLIAEASNLRPALSTPEVKVASVPVPAPVPAPVTPQPVMIQPAAPQPFLKFGNVPMAKATRERPFENTLGMKFVPVPATAVLFCIWETRVKDYAHYARGKNVDRSWETQPKGEIAAGREPDHPVCRVICGATTC